jgi:hypothetical protein
VGILSGEWWLDTSGQATFADGDVGDVNHEIAAFQHFIGLSEDVLERYEIRPDEIWEDEVVAGDFLNQYKRMMLDEMPELEDFIVGGEIDWAHAFYDKKSREKLKTVLVRLAKKGKFGQLPSAAINKEKIIAGLAYFALIQLGLNHHFIENGGMSDARKYALVHGGWIRVNNDAFEMQSFDDDTLRAIIKSEIWEEASDPETLEISDEIINIYENKTQNFFEVPVSMLFGNLTAVEIKAKTRYGARKAAFSLNPQADMVAMVAAALKWKGAATKIDMLYAEYGIGARYRLKHSNMTTKADLDNYLMRKFNIDAATARDVSNELTHKNYRPDLNADIAEFIEEPWAVEALKLLPNTWR